ncbi:MAG: AmmeMemoRadiSam system radical SAM enzyme [Oligoflexia bacterium]|nr:AmmeMemoRadiSam system radical SAM enzyme [Oligoflexia bacterium]
MSQAVECDLCPHLCRIEPGQAGECRVRVNVNGKLLAVTWGYPVALHVDPVEKKPLFHFLPGAPVFSLATVGCNLHCQGCQNWEISQSSPEDVPAYELPPKQVAATAAREGCPAVAYTYAEPLVFYEYTLDCARACRERGIRNILVSAGYINPAPMKELAKVLDAAILDVKAMSDEIYRRHAGGTLEPVLDTLRIAHDAGVWVEVLNLLVPTLNDDDALVDKLIAFVHDELGADTPLHFTAFHPDYKLRNLPRTPTSTLLNARRRALDAGLHHVYVGNVSGGDGESTWCPHCGELLIERAGYRILADHLSGTGRCPRCQQAIAGVWT